MPYDAPTETDRAFLAVAFEEARIGHAEGGVPVGGALAVDGELVARGRNRLCQEDNPILHGETDCLRKAGRDAAFDRASLYTTLSPCAMCAGAVIRFGIPRLVVGEDRNFAGELDWLDARGVEIVLVQDPEMIAFFAAYIRANATTWGEDISGYAR